MKSMKSLETVKSFEISEIRENSTDFEIRTPLCGVGDPSSKLSNPLSIQNL